MNWLLESGDFQVKFIKSCVVGRDEFPDEVLMSREHFEIVIKKDKAFLRDMQSTNGTLVNGKPLPPGKLHELKETDIIKAGDREFIVTALRRAFSANWIALGSAVLVYAIWMGTALSDRSMAYGRSIGFYNVGIIAEILLLSVLICALVLRRLLARKVWGERLSAFYFFALLISAMFLNDWLFKVADQQWQLTMEQQEAKISYFCTERFDALQCIYQVSQCVRCARAVELDKIKAAKQNLSNFQKQVKERIDATERKPAESIFPKGK